MPKSKEERRKSRQDDYDEVEGDYGAKRRNAPSSSSANNMLQMAAELVPSFNGKDGTYPVVQWVNDVEDNAEIFGWTPLQQLLVARRSLTGTAALWLRSEKTHKNWEDLKQAITKEFPDTVDIKSVHEMMSARKKKSNESCLDYMLIMKDLGKRGKMPDYVAIKYIVDGIIDMETNKIMLYGVTSYSELKEKIKIYETIKSKMTKKPTEKDSVAENRNDVSKQKIKRIRCYGCGELGHASLNCPHKDKGLKCFKCNEFGHVGSTCMKRTSERMKSLKKPEEAIGNNRQTSDDSGTRKRAMFGTMAETATDFTPAQGDSTANSVERNGDPKMADYQSDNESELSMSTSSDSESEVMVNVNKVNYTNKFRKTRKPVVSTKIGGYCVETLIDSGSEVNIISSDFYEALGKPVCESDNVKLSGIGLSTVCSIGKCRLSFCFDGQSFESVIFHIISKDCIPYHAIIGQEFLNDVAVIIDNGIVRLVSDECYLNVCVSEVCFSDFSIGPMTNSVLKENIIDWVKAYKPYTPVKEPPLQLKIVLKDEVPVSQRPRRLSLKEQELVEQQVTEWLNNGIVRVSYSEYSSPLVLVKKKDGSTRVCVDYRALNKKIVKDEFPLPIIEDLIDKLKDAKFFSVLDLKNGFFHLRVSEESIPYTSFVSHHGQFEFVRAPEVMIFIDDILIPAGSEEYSAFSTLRRKLGESPVLKLYQPNLPTEVHTDASCVAYSAILLQLYPDGLHPVYYMSKRTSEAESKYSSYELEALAVIEGVKKFHVYLYGTQFKIVTDCQAFEQTLKKKDLSAKVARWVLFLDQFDYKVEHRSGYKMRHADALSRNPAVAIITHTLHNQVRTAQLSDEGPKAISELLKISSYSDYWLDDGLLYKGDLKQLVIPKSMEKEIIKQVHSNGHFAVRKMKELIVKDYYIKDLDKKLQDFVTTCIPCLLATKKSGKQEGSLNPIEKESVPLHTLHVDHIGPLTETKKQYNYILTMVDAFTKFTWIFPTKSTKSKETLDKLRIHQQHFGNPVRMVTDKGTAFTSNEFREFCAEENIQHVTITTGVPRGNGQVERVHRTIIAVLTKLCIENPSLWYRHVSRLQRALNSTYQRSINTSPFQLIIGTRMRSKEDLEIVQLLQQEEVEQYDKGREELRILAKQQILKVQDENRRNFDKGRKESSKYEVGELVAIKRTQFGAGLKLKPKYLGPYKILKVKRNDRYDVEKADACADGPLKTSTCADQMKRWPLLAENESLDG